MRRTRRLAAALVAVAVAAAASGCQAWEDATGAGVGAATVPSAFDVADWGVLDTLVSVAIVNTSDRTLRYGQGLVRALDADGEVVASSDGRGPCCTIVDLRPGATYGVYVDAGSAGGEVVDVDVEVRNVSWAPAGDTAPPEGVSAVVQGLRATPRGAVVDADLHVGDPGEQLLVQAFVTDADGAFLGVVSGRWNCLPAGVSPIRMQLFHPVPAGARVDRVTAHSMADLPGADAPRCEATDRAG